MDKVILVTGAQVLRDDSGEPVDVHEIVIGIFDNSEAALQTGEAFKDAGLVDAFVLEEKEILSTSIYPPQGKRLIHICTIEQ